MSKFSVFSQLHQLYWLLYVDGSIEKFDDHNKLHSSSNKYNNSLRSTMLSDHNAENSSKIYLVN